MSSKLFYPARHATHTVESHSTPDPVTGSASDAHGHHPDTASRIVGAIIGAMAGTAVVGMIVGAIVAPIAAPALLALVGFGSAGPIAGKFTLLCVSRSAES